MSESSRGGYCLGFGAAVPLDARPKVAKDQRPIFKPRPLLDDFPPLKDSPVPYERNYFVDWIHAFVRMVEDNVKNDGGRLFDIEANTKLGRILETVEKVGKELDPR